MLAVRYVHIAYYVYYPAVSLFRKAFVLATVPRLHVEDGNMEPLGADDAQARIRVAQHQNGIGFRLSHQLIAAIYDVAHGGTKILAYSIHINFRIGKFKVTEKDSIQVVVVVLARVGKQDIEVFPAFADDCG